jgi:hypothetical protein
MTQIEIFDKIIAKHDEYYQCIQHIHLRGANDVREETIPLVEEASKQGYSGNEFKKYVHEVNPLIKFKGNIFLRAVIHFLNNNQIGGEK